MMSHYANEKCQAFQCGEPPKGAAVIPVAQIGFALTVAVPVNMVFAFREAPVR